MTLLASDTFHLSARASQEAGRVVAVQFYAGDTLLATVETEPYVYAWKNPPVGIHRLRARAIDASGKYADTPITAVRAIEQPVIELDAGLAGAQIDGDHLRVSGRIVAPSNSALTVNGLPATITELDRFFVNDLPLQIGSNVVTLNLSSEATEKASSSFEVSSLRLADFLVTVDRSEGLAPLNTNLIITNQGQAAFSRVEVDKDNDGHTDHTLLSLPNDQVVIPLQYTEPGIYKIEVVVFGTNGNRLFRAELEVVAGSPVLVALSGVSLYQAFLGRLRAGKIDSAAAALGSAIRDSYRQALENLGAHLVEVVDSLGSVRSVDVTDDYTILRVHKQTLAGLREYEVTLMRDEDGVRRIMGF